MRTATILEFNNEYSVWGIRLITTGDDKKIYETYYLHSISNKKYKTKENAIKAMNKRGCYDFIDTDKNTFQDVISYLEKRKDKLLKVSL